MDYETIMQANLERVFGERDSARRIEAIRELYVEDAELHEPQQSVRGHDAISQAVTDLLAQLPPDFTFTAIRPALALNHIARLQWRAGPPKVRIPTKSPTYSDLKPPTIPISSRP